MTYAEQLAEAKAYEAQEREVEARRRESAARWLHTLYASNRGSEGPILIMAAVAEVTA